MRLVGYRTTEGSWIGRLDGESKLVPLGRLEQFWDDPAQAILRPSGDVLDVEELTLVPPVPPVARILCVGLNYADHVAEGTFQREENHAPSVWESRSFAPLAFQGSPIGSRFTMRSSCQNANPRLSSAKGPTFGMPRYRRFVPFIWMTVSPSSYCG